MSCAVAACTWGAGGDDERDASEPAQPPAATPPTRAVSEAAIDEAPVLAMIRRSDVAVHLRVTSAEPFEHPEGGIATRHRIEPLRVLRSTATRPFAVTEIVVGNGQLGDQVTTSPHEPTLVVGDEYLLLANADARTVLVRPQAAQLIRRDGDPAWRLAIDSLDSLGELGELGRDAEVAR